MAANRGVIVVIVAANRGVMVVIGHVFTIIDTKNEQN